MEIFKIIGIAFIATILCIILKQTRPEFAMLLALITGVLIFFICQTKVMEIVDVLRNLSDKAGMPRGFLGILLKVIAISYITEFASNICKDVGETAIASKVQFAGKCSILILSMSIIGSFVDTLVGIF